MHSSRLALTLGGGGARAAYQVGVLRAIARRYPQLRISLLTGVSAGAINISHLANFSGDFADGVEALTELWHRLELENVFRSGGLPLLWRGARIGMQLSIGLDDVDGPRANEFAKSLDAEFVFTGCDRNIRFRAERNKCIEILRRKRFFEPENLLLFQHG